MNCVALKLTEGKPRKSKIPYARFLLRRHGFYFVDVPRTSSTSIRHDLGRRFGLPYTKYPPRSPKLMLRNHLSALEIRELFGEPLWDKLFTFTMVRNPWARMYSWYRYCRPRQKSGFREFVLAVNASRPENPVGKQQSAANPTAQRHAKKPESPVRKRQLYSRLLYRAAADYVCDKRGRILVDYVARYEHRERDLDHIRKRLNMKTLGGRPLNRSTPRGDHYSRHYDGETGEIVRTMYARDIELFGYEFEDKR